MPWSDLATSILLLLEVLGLLLHAVNTIRPLLAYINAVAIVTFTSSFTMVQSLESVGRQHPMEMSELHLPFE